MSQRVLQRQIRWAAMAVALISFYGAFAPGTAHATCGDWLDHSASSISSAALNGNSLLDESFTEGRSNPRESMPSVPRCRGPQCGSAPLPISVPQPRPISPTNELSAVLTALLAQMDVQTTGLASSDDEEPSVGVRGRVERPPRTL